MVVDHVGGVDAENWNFVPDDVEVEQFAFAFALDSDSDHGAFGPFQQLHHVTVGDPDARDVFAFHRHDAVACPDAELLRRASADGRHYHDRVLENVELHANAFEVSLKRLVGLLQFFCREVHRVGVQIFKHAHHRRLHEVLQVDGVDVQLVDVAQQGAKLLGRRLRRGFGLLSIRRAGGEQHGEGQRQEVGCVHENVKIRGGGQQGVTSRP